MIRDLFYNRNLNIKMASTWRALVQINNRKKLDRIGCQRGLRGSSMGIRGRSLRGTSVKKVRMMAFVYVLMGGPVLYRRDGIKEGWEDRETGRSTTLEI